MHATKGILRNEMSTLVEVFRNGFTEQHFFSFDFSKVPKLTCRQRYSKQTHHMAHSGLEQIECKIEDIVIRSLSKELSVPHRH